MYVGTLAQIDGCKVKAKGLSGTYQGLKPILCEATPFVTKECGFYCAEVIDKLRGIDIGNRGCDRMSKGLCAGERI
jgi:hypothetical protein